MRHTRNALLLLLMLMHAFSVYADALEHSRQIHSVCRFGFFLLFFSLSLFVLFILLLFFLRFHLHRTQFHWKLYRKSYTCIWTRSGFGFGCTYAENEHSLFGSCILHTNTLHTYTHFASIEICFIFVSLDLLFSFHIFQFHADTFFLSLSLKDLSCNSCVVVDELTFLCVRLMLLIIMAVFCRCSFRLWLWSLALASRRFIIAVSLNFFLCLFFLCACAFKSLIQSLRFLLGTSLSLYSSDAHFTMRQECLFLYFISCFLNFIKKNFFCFNEFCLYFHTAILFNFLFHSW